MNQIHLSKRFSFERIRWYFSCYLFLPPSGQVVYFYKADYYCIILIRYLHAEVLQNKCLKNFARFTGKYLRQSLFLISLYPATFFNKRCQHSCFLVNFAKMSRTPFLQNTLKLLFLYLWNIPVI